MLWLSDDEGDPPWWVWVAMLLLVIGSMILGRVVWHEAVRHDFAHISLRLLARAAMLFCFYWFAARFWFWFDKS